MLTTWTDRVQYHCFRFVPSHTNAPPWIQCTRVFKILKRQSSPQSYLGTSVVCHTKKASVAGEQCFDNCKRHPSPQKCLIDHEPALDPEQLPRWLQHMWQGTGIIQHVGMHDLTWRIQMTPTSSGASQSLYVPSYSNTFHFLCKYTAIITIHYRAQTSHYTLH